MSAAAGGAGRIIRPVADMLARARGALVSQALFGEVADILQRREGMLRVRLRGDGYEGLVEESALGPAAPEGGAEALTPAIPQTLLFPQADIKAAPAQPLYMGARVHAEGKEGPFLRLREGGHAIAAHLRPFGQVAEDAAAIAGMFLHAPYLWGGRTWAGVDCSGLVQMALVQSGHEGIPRDSGDQAASTGAPLPLRAAVEGGLQRGDLVFWKGHVAMMLDERRIIHANAHHMRVAIEPLAQAAARIAAGGGGAITALRRP